MEKITIKTTVNQPIEIVWKSFTAPEHITKWNFAAEDWHCPTAENDLKIGGMLKSRMEAKDGSFGFDFEAVYDDVKTNEFLKYHLTDHRSVEINFKKINNNLVEVSEAFDPESENPIEMQRDGWQAILDQFKTYTETL